MSKGIVGLCITRVARVRYIWDEVLFRIRVYFDGLVISKMVLLESIHRIETYLDVVVEVLAF